MIDIYRKRRFVLVFILLVFFIFVVTINTSSKISTNPSLEKPKLTSVSKIALDGLKNIKIKGRAPKTNYSRDQFGKSWNIKNGCDTRNIILNRDLINTVVDNDCNVSSGTLNDPYTGKIIQFKRGSGTSSLVQIDHVVSLSDAWQKGAQQFSSDMRISLANDSLELLAVDGKANLQKSDGDAATWLPSNKAFRCQYVARQIAVKKKYDLWVTQSEHDAIQDVLKTCPNQLLPIP